MSLWQWQAALAVSSGALACAVSRAHAVRPDLPILQPASIHQPLTSTVASTPAFGARMSTVTLSVSICAIVSSSATAWPCFFSTAAMVPSVMLSPAHHMGLSLWQVMLRRANVVMHCCKLTHAGNLDLHLLHAQGGCVEISGVPDVTADHA